MGSGQPIGGWAGRALRGRLRTWLAAGLAALVLAFLGWAVAREWDTLKAYPWRFHAGYVVLASVFHSLALGATFVAWHLMMRRIAGFGDLRTNARIYYLSTLAKRIPTAVWYIGGRLVMYQEVGVARSAVLNATALETILIGMMGVLVYLLFLPFYPYAPASATWILGVLGGAAFVLFAARPRLLLDVTNALLRRWHRAPIRADVTRRDLLVWGAVYVAPWPLAGVALYFMIRAVTGGVPADLPSVVGISTLSMLVALLSLVLPGGMGLKELTIAALLSPWMPLSVGIVVAVVYRILQTVDDALWALAAGHAGAAGRR